MMAMGDYMWTRAETKYNINVNMRPEYEPITIRGRQIKAQIQGIKEVTYGGKATITRYWVWSKINWDSLGLEITKIPIGILVIFKDKEN
jgi:hypothetical protein